MIKNLTKNEYYRSKNIPLPKICCRIVPEPSARLHLNELVPNLSYEVLKILENNTIQNEINCEIAQCYKIINEQQTTIQTLKQEINERDEELIEKKLSKDADDRKIAIFEREIFNLKDFIQKIEYEQKVHIEALHREFSSSIAQEHKKLQTLERLLEETRRQTKRVTQQEFQEHQIKMADFQKEYSQQINTQIISNQNLKKQSSKLTAQCSRLRFQLISSEKDNMNNLKQMEKENASLHQKYLKKEFQIQNQKRNRRDQESLLKSNILQLKNHSQFLHTCLEEQKIKQISETNRLQQQSNEHQNKLKIIIEDLCCEKKKLVEELTEINRKYYEVEKKLKNQKIKFNELEQAFQKQQSKMVNYQQQMEIAFNEKLNKNQMEFQKQRNQLEQINNAEFEKQKKKILLEEKTKYQFELNALKFEKDSFILQMQKNVNEKENQITRQNQIITQIQEEVRKSHRNLMDLKTTIQSMNSVHSEENNQILLGNFNKIESLKLNFNQIIEKQKKQHENLIKNKDQQINNVKQKLKIIENLRMQRQTQNIFLKNESSRLIQGIHTKQMQIVSIQAQVNGLNQECLSFKTIIQALEEQKARKQSYENQLKLQIQNLFQKLCESDSYKLQSLRKFKQAEQELLQKNHHLDQKRYKLQKQVQNLTNQLEMQRVLIKRQQQKNSTLQKQIQFYKLEENKLKINISNTLFNQQQYVLALKGQYDELKNKLSENYRIKQQQIIIESEKHAQRNFTFNQQIIQLQDKINQKSEEHFKRQIEIVSLKKQIERKDADFQENKKKLEFIQRESQATKIKNIQQDKEISKLSIKIQNLMKQILVKDTNILNLNERKSSQQRQMQGLKNEIIKKQIEMKQMNKILFQVKEECEQRSKNDLKDRNKMAEESLTHKNGYVQQISLLQSKISKLESSLIQKQAYIGEISKKNINQINQFQDQRNQITKIMKDYKHQNSQLNNIMNQLKDQIQSLTKDCDQFIKERNQKIQLLEHQNAKFIESQKLFALKVNDLESEIFHIKRNHQNKLQEQQKKIYFLQENKYLIEKQLTSKQREQKQFEAIFQNLQNQQKKLLQQIFRRDKELQNINVSFNSKLNELTKNIKEQAEISDEEHLKEQEFLKRQIQEIKHKMIDEKNKHVQMSSEWSEKYNSILIKLKSSNKQLIQYKKKWARICGEVNDFSHQLSQIDESEQQIEIALKQMKKESNYNYLQEFQEERTSETRRQVYKVSTNSKNMNPQNFRYATTLIENEESMDLSKYQLTISSQSAYSDKLPSIVLKKNIFKET